MWDRVAAELRERNRFGQLRDYGRSRSSVLTKADLQRQLGYLDGAPEMQRDAIEAFKERQAERDAEMARRARRNGHGKQAAHAFMKQRRGAPENTRRRVSADERRRQLSSPRRRDDRRHGGSGARCRRRCR